MERTYLQTINVFRDISERHYFVKEFLSDAPLKINDTVKKFPAVCIYPTGSKLQQNAINYTLRMFVVDIVQRENKNKDKIISDTEQIIQDFKVELISSASTYGIYIQNTDMPLTKFSETFPSVDNTDDEHIIAGNYIDWNITVIANPKLCNLPIAPYTASTFDLRAI